SLIENRFTTLKIYDVLGKEVYTLVNEKQNAGNYKVKFDGSMLQSGVYFYKLKSGEFTETKRMILSK
ncbi:MAG: T9SS type A sorting domain-containing protein, partial [bacterium]